MGRAADVSAIKYFRRLAGYNRERAEGARRAGNDAAARKYDATAAGQEARAAEIEARLK